MNTKKINHLMFFSLFLAFFFISFDTKALAETEHTIGKPHIIWHNSTTGAVKLMPINNMIPESKITVTNTSNPNLIPKGVGDFNGDGKADILLHNQTTGMVDIWVMDGSKIVDNITLFESSNTNLQIAGVGDFDEDGDPDIATFNIHNGSLIIWVMNGTKKLRNKTVLRGANRNLVPRGVGDMDNDGMPDIILRNNNSGAVRVWTMNSNFTRKGNHYLKGSSNTNLELRGVIDINDDGNNDILNYNTTTGKLKAWLMDNNFVIKKNVTITKENDLDWSAREGYFIVSGVVVSGNYLLTAWNDLGMHCMDGNDYSVFSVLPPYNNLHAQLKDKNGDLITSGVTVTYQSTLGTDGKLNTTSTEANDGTMKTNFWDHVSNLFGATLSPDVGLTGNPVSSMTPAPMTFNQNHQWWEAEGIPMSPYNDDGSKNYYPLVKVTAKDTAGNVLAQVDAVLPVSDEMDCKRCHASNSVADAKPDAGWVNDSDAQKDYKYNILRLHDEEEPNAVNDNLSALQAKGYNYNANGLEVTARAGTPILCVACHKSNALPGVGLELKPFTQAIHTKHSSVTDPISGMKLGDINNRESCYTCHPGAATECLRGAMGDAKNPDGTARMQCQSCHGTMQAVGHETRKGWLNQPNCQACHHDGIQETSAIDPATNTLRHVVDTRFATNLNTPATGLSLYRFSTGHGDLQCEACHGSTHAIYPAHEADNKVSIAAQGHTGTIAECTACHTSAPRTTDEGPHGMHTVGQSWVEDHEDVAEHNAAQCKACHGADYRGSVLSKTWTARSFSIEHGTKNFAKGHQISCYDCHNGPNGD